MDRVDKRAPNRRANGLEAPENALGLGYGVNPVTRRVNPVVRQSETVSSKLESHRVWKVSIYRA